MINLCKYCEFCQLLLSMFSEPKEHHWPHPWTFPDLWQKKNWQNYWIWKMKQRAPESSHLQMTKMSLLMMEERGTIKLVTLVTIFRPGQVSFVIPVNPNFSHLHLHADSKYTKLFIKIAKAVILINLKMPKVQEKLDNLYLFFI